LVAVGLWIDISVKILQLPNFVELVREPLSKGKFNTIYNIFFLTIFYFTEMIILRSILMVTFENIDYLLCALGDGSLCYFHLNPENGALSAKRKVNINSFD